MYFLLCIIPGGGEQGGEHTVIRLLGETRTGMGKEVNGQSGLLVILGRFSCRT